MEELEAEVVVIGAGAVGSSTAYHLSKAGRKVVLLDRGSIGGGCSSATYAGINISAKEGDCYLRFTLEASRLYRGLQEELDADLEWVAEGNIAHVVEREDDWGPILRNLEELGRVPGIDMQVVKMPEALRIEPTLPRWIQGITFCPVDGAINPFKLVNGYVRGAKRRGAQVRVFTEVRGIEVRGGQVEWVETSRGRIHTPWVVNAAGVDSPKIGRMVGATIPVVPAHGQVATTVRVKQFLRYPLRGLAQKESGNLFVGSTKGFVGTDKNARVELIPGSVGKFVRLFPFLKEVPVQRLWVGSRPWPIDGLPILGPVGGVKGFLVATGHSGVTLAEMIGRVMADLVVEGESSVDIDHYRPDRFKGDQMSYLMKMYRQAEVA